MRSSIMRYLAIGILLLSSFSSLAFQPNESQLKEHDHYVNKAGNIIHSPAHTQSGNAPEGASAKCRDGSYSFSRSHRGTCSHHGGVSNWL